MARTKTYKNLYWALIVTFTMLYLAVAFVSTLHAITFFQITNTLWLAILLGAAYEIGQATVLFSIIMTENKNKMLAWLMMFLLTSLQVTANVYASFMYMDTEAGNSWEYWQRSILFWIDADTPEMYKIIISWISGALLPLVALGMTALVADNVQHTQNEKSEEEKENNSQKEEKKEDEEDEEDEEDSLDKMVKGIGDIFKRKNKKEDKDELSKNKDDIVEDSSEFFDNYDENNLINLQDQLKNETLLPKKQAEEDSKEIVENTIKSQPITTDTSKLNKNEDDQRPQFDPIYINEDKKEEETQSEKEQVIKPSNIQRGWHLKNRYVDNEGKVFSKGKYIGMEDTSANETPPLQSKKVKG